MEGRFRVIEVASFDLAQELAESTHIALDILPDREGYFLILILGLIILQHLIYKRYPCPSVAPVLVYRCRSGRFLTREHLSLTLVADDFFENSVYLPFLIEQNLIVEIRFVMPLLASQYKLCRPTIISQPKIGMYANPHRLFDQQAHRGVVQTYGILSEVIEPTVCSQYKFSSHNLLILNLLHLTQRM